MVPKKNTVTKLIVGSYIIGFYLVNGEDSVRLLRVLLITIL